MFIHANGYNRYQDLQAPYNAILPSGISIYGLNQVTHDYGGMLYPPNTEDRLLPYLVNDVGYHAKQMFIPNCDSLTTEEIREYKNLIDGYTVNLPNTFNMCILYTNDLEETNNWLPDNYEEIVEDDTEVGTAIAQFKNVMQRLYEDDGYDLWNIDYKFFKLNTRHSLIAVCNNCYMKQHRIEYFTLALAQLVFPELYTNFIQEEKDIYTEMLHQVILKRMVRARVQDKADILATTTKYNDYFSEKNIVRTLNLLMRQRIQTLKDNVERYHGQAEDLLRQYTEAVTNFNNASQEMIAKESNANSEIEELKTILNQPYISNIRINGNTMYLTFQSYLDYYDTDLLDCVLNGLETVRTRDENYSIFLNEVFKGEHYRLRVQSNFRYQLAGNNRGLYNIRVNQDDYDAEAHERLCNPHLQFYNCLGSYASQLAKAQADSNLAVFIGLALASTRSINFADGAVSNRLKEAFDPDRNDNILNRKCLEDAEGNLYTIKEVIDKVKYASPVVETQDTLVYPLPTEESEAEFVW